MLLKPAPTVLSRDVGAATTDGSAIAACGVVATPADS